MFLKYLYVIIHRIKKKEVAIYGYQSISFKWI